MIQWDESRQILTDYMGYPLSRSEAVAYREAIRKHLKNSAADLAEIANQKLKKEMPHYPPYSAEGFV